MEYFPLGRVKWGRILKKINPIVSKHSDKIFKEDTVILEAPYAFLEMTVLQTLGEHKLRYLLMPHPKSSYDFGLSQIPKSISGSLGCLVVPDGILCSAVNSCLNKCTPYSYTHLPRRPQLLSRVFNPQW